MVLPLLQGLKRVPNMGAESKVQPAAGCPPQVPQDLEEWLGRSRGCGRHVSCQHEGPHSCAQRQSLRHLTLVQQNVRANAGCAALQWRQDRPFRVQQRGGRRRPSALKMQLWGRPCGHAETAAWGTLGQRPERLEQASPSICCGLAGPRNAEICRRKYKKPTLVQCFGPTP